MAMRWLPLLLGLAAVLPGAGSAQSIKVEVLSIGDGDTISAVSYTHLTLPTKA